MRPSPHLALVLLRASLGLLLVVWGGDKLRDAEHGVQVSEHFYGGLFSSPALVTAFGALEILVGLAIVAGFARRLTYPALLVVTGATLLVVWRSVLDPLGLVLEGTQLLFFPSLIIFAGALVLVAFQEQDAWALDAVRRRVRARAAA